MSKPTSINWGASYTSSFRLSRVDPTTWASSDDIVGTLNASIEKDRSGDLIDSGTVTIAMPIEETPEWFYGRIELLAEQDGVFERQPIATLLFEPGVSTANNGIKEVQYDGRSVLAPADDEVVLAGETVNRGVSGATMAAALLRRCVKAPIVVESGFTLGSYVTFAESTTILEAAWMLLDAAGWCMRVDGNGVVTISAKPTDVSLSLDQVHASLLEPEVGHDDGLSSMPNRYIVIDGDRMCAAVDDDPESPTSTVRRGRFVDMVDSSPTLVDKENLQSYADRRLKEETSVLGKRTYVRDFWPDTYPYSLVRGSIASVGLVGDMRVLSQSYDISDTGLMVTEISEVLR